jgi:hypothetical protein
MDYLFSVTANYERIHPLQAYLHLAFRVGLGMSGESGSELVIMSHSALLVGKQKHFLEMGVGYYQTFNYKPSFFPILGYRFMGKRGFYLKAFMKLELYTDPEWIDEWGQANIWPGVQLGYRYVFK